VTVVDLSAAVEEATFEAPPEPPEGALMEEVESKEAETAA